MEDANLNALVRVLAGEIEKFYSNPENERNFEEWRKLREENQLKGGKT